MVVGCCLILLFFNPLIYYYYLYRYIMSSNDGKFLGEWTEIKKKILKIENNNDSIKDRIKNKNFWLTFLKNIVTIFIALFLVDELSIFFDEIFGSIFFYILFLALIIGLIDFLALMILKLIVSIQNNMKQTI